MSKKYRVAVYIGRFQPFHNGHLSTLKKAQELADKVIVLVGSSNVAPNSKNPWSFVHRGEMILPYLRRDENDQMIDTVLPIYDHQYNDNAWVASVQKTVWTIVDPYDFDSICIVGVNKDESTYYLDLFPQWKFESNEEYHEPGKSFNATEMRTVIYEWILQGMKQPWSDKAISPILQLPIPKASLSYLCKWMQMPIAKQLAEEYAFVKDYKKQWSVAPYPPTFVTVDAVVVQSGHVLLVQRGAMPGKGLYALPGGFINQNERIEDAMIRELREETGIKVPAPVLRGSIKERGVFDDPNRSLRGRTITHAFYIELAPGTLPKVKGSDDAAAAKWVALADLPKMERTFYEDHYAIIQKFIG